MAGASKPSYAAGRLAPGLRVATHNVRGLRGASTGVMAGLAKAHALVRLWWCQLRLDIVCVQECKVKASDRSGQQNIEHAVAAAAEELGAPGYKFFWDLNPAAASGGVAILVRADWLARGRLTVANNVTKGKDGRLLALRCKWAGHAFSLVNCYLPSGDAAGQRAFVSGRLAPFLQRNGCAACIMAGDFNFTTDWRVDRAQLSAGVHGTASSGGPPSVLAGHVSTSGPSRRSEEQVAAVMAAACTAAGGGHPETVDAFRHLHPRARSFTFHCHNAAARLDRLYVSRGLLPHLAQCYAAPVALSDHRPVVLRLLPLLPSTEGRGVRRVGVRFLADPDLEDQFLAGTEHLATAAPSDDHALLAWWPGSSGLWQTWPAG